MMFFLIKKEAGEDDRISEKEASARCCPTYSSKRLILNNTAEN